MAMTTTSAAGYNPNVNAASNMAKVIIAKGQKEGVLDSAAGAAASQALAISSSTGEGALSNRTHVEQMRQVEEVLTRYAASHTATLDAINGAVQDFLRKCRETTTQVMELQRELFQDRKSPTFKDDMEIAKLLVEFTTTASKSLSSQTTDALQIVKTGASTKKEETAIAVGVFIASRTEQLTLFQEKFKVLRVQESHQLQMVLDIQKAQLEADSALFASMKEVALFEASRQDAAAAHALEVEKAQLGQLLALRSLEIQEQTAENAHQIALLEVAIKEGTARRAHAAEVRRIDATHAEVQAKTAADSRTAQAKIAADLRTAEGQQQADVTKTRITTGAAVQEKQIAATTQVRQEEVKARVEIQKSADAQRAAEIAARFAAQTAQLQSSNATSVEHHKIDANRSSCVIS